MAHCHQTAAITHNAGKHGNHDHYHSEHQSTSTSFKNIEPVSPNLQVSSPPNAPSTTRSSKVPDTPSRASSNMTRNLTDEEFLRQLQRHEVTTAGEMIKKLQAEQTPWTQKTPFKIAVVVVIWANSVVMGIETNVIGNPDHETWLFVFEHIFCCLFLMELITRLHVEGARQYFGDIPNILDFFLVTMAIIDSWILTPFVDSEANIRMLSLLRMLRLMRLARLLRLFKTFKELNIIVSGFVSSFRTLFWTSIFLMIVVYMYAIFSTHVFGPGSADDEGNCRRLKAAKRAGVENLEDSDCALGAQYPIGVQYELFGSLQQSMLTLYTCTFDGCGWELMQPMIKKQPLAAGFWYTFIFITSFGIMNVIIGLFCENVMVAALESQKEMKQNFEERRLEHIINLKKLFQELDQDGSGNITRTEYLNALRSNKAVMSVLEQLGLQDEIHLFDTLDVQTDGVVSIQDFFEGMMMLMNAHEEVRVKDIVPTYLTCQSIHYHLQRTLDILEGHQQVDNWFSKETALLHSKIDNLAAEFRQEIDEIKRAQSSSTQAIIAAIKGTHVSPHTSKNSLSKEEHQLLDPDTSYNTLNSLSSREQL